MRGSKDAISSLNRSDVTRINADEHEFDTIGVGPKFLKILRHLQEARRANVWTTCKSEKDRQRTSFAGTNDVRDR